MQKITKKLLIFDWDGTLADSVNKIISCKQRLAKEHFLSIPSDETIKSVLGMEFMLALKKCFPNAQEKELEHFAERFQVLINSKEYQSDLFPFARKTLEELKKRKMKLAVATSKSRAALNHALQYAGISELFDLTCCGEEYYEKPNPAMLLHICSELKVHPSNSLYIGDTVIDVFFAKNASINVICTSFGAGNQNELIKHQPLKIINNWQNFLDIIDTQEN